MSVGVRKEWILSSRLGIKIICTRKMSIFFLNFRLTLDVIEGTYAYLRTSEYVRAGTYCSVSTV